jgi:hypothetical protein
MNERRTTNDGPHTMSTTRSPAAVLDRLRQPEHTGENRCTPCTATNLLVGSALGVGAVWLPAGMIVLLVSLVAIYLRGYLVPGTPTLTKRYFPEWLLRRFDKEPTSDPAAVNDPGELEEFLLRADVLEPCRDGDDLRLTHGFREAWHARIRDRRSTTGSASGDRPGMDELLDVTPDRVSVERHGDVMVASVDGARVAQWESRAADVADVAASGTLQDHHAAWTGLGFDARTRVLGGLRLWLDRCPTCDGEIQSDQETVESCCRSKEVVAATCQECGTRLMEAEYEGDSAPPAG